MLYILNDVENKMTVYFITRHKGALEWAKEEHVHYDVHFTHLANFDELC
jgi:CRISPR-associated protein Csx16